VGRYRSHPMGMSPPGPAPGPTPVPAPVQPQTRFSADGFWWWDGKEWKPAISQDRLWRWNGSNWIPAAPAGGRAQGGMGGGGLALILVLSFVGILILVGGVVLVVLLTMGNQISNVFSNVTAALNGS